MKKISVLFTILLFSVSYYAQNLTINNATIALWEGGTEDVIFTEKNFDKNNLGTFNSGDELFLKSVQIYITKANGEKVTDADVYFRIYKNGEVPGEFITMHLPFYSDIKDADGRKNQICLKNEPDNSGINLLNGISSGIYLIEVYFTVKDKASETYYLNNSSLNYIAQFTYSEISAITKSRGVANTDIFDILPVPEDEKLSIQFITATNIDNIKMINNQSSVVYEGGKSRGAPGTPVDISIEDMEAGTYFIRVQTEKGISVQRVVIAK